LKRAIF